MVRFAHLADVHIGAWREPKMRVLPERALSAAIDRILSADLDFVIIAGDLFNTALPGIEQIRHVFRELQRLKDASVPVYFIAGSHDYSPTGKTMLSVLEEAGLATDVCRLREEDGRVLLEPVTDERTGTKIVGILGRAGQLDSEDYERLDKESLEALPGPKVFVFHAAVREVLGERFPAMDAFPLTYFPKGFDYYAGGHVHIVTDTAVEGYGRFSYPGPLFPASFPELEEVGVPGFDIVTLEDAVSVRRVELPVIRTWSASLDCAGKEPADVEAALREQLPESLEGTVVLVRLSEELSVGSAADIDFRSLFAECERRGAYFCMRNTVMLTSPQLRRNVLAAHSSEEIERRVIDERAGSVPLPGFSAAQEKELFSRLLRALAQSQTDGEKKKEYELRVAEQALSSLKAD